MRIVAVVTAYHPDERLDAVVAAALETCEAVLVVDNTPADAPSTADSREGVLEDPRVRVLRSGRNAGLGGAMNAGLAALPDEAEAVLLLDQDSILTKEVVQGLAAHLERDATIGVASPAPWDEATDSHYESLSAARYGEVADRDAVITSGMLIRRSCLERVPGFRESFFIDYVDLDFCLRLRRARIRIIQDKSLKLPHSIGDRRAHRVGPMTVPVIHYPAWRHYWIARNGRILIRENRKALPAWSFRTLLYLVRWVTVTALFEPGRGSSLRAFFRGLGDGRTGGVSAAYLPSGAEYVSDF